MFSGTIYWKDGKKETISGDNLEDAFIQAGYDETFIEMIDKIIACESSDNNHDWDVNIPISSEG